MKLPPNERLITYIKLYKRTQWWSLPELKKLQQKKLRNLLIHAYNNVPYYHKIFNELNIRPEDINNVTELKKLPILTKEKIRNNFNYLTARNYSTNRLTLSSTSGSTGTPMKFFIDNRWSASNMGAAYRAWSWAGYRPGDKISYLWGAPDDFKEGYKLRTKIRSFLLREMKLNANALTEKNMRKYVELLKKFKPKIINTYGSVIFILSKYIEDSGIDIDFFKPKAILTTADMLYDHNRKFIEKTFNCDVFDYYSGRDTSLQAAECSEHFGYHLSIENAVIEFVNDNEHVSPGETGKIIITDLSNFAMPFIRYEIGDLGIPSDEICPCGRKLPIMKSLKGRTFDFIVTPDNRLIPGEFFHYTIIDHNIKGIKEFQIFQKEINKIIIYIVENENEEIKDINRFIDLIQKKVGEMVKIEVKYTSTIKRTPSGKLRHIISNVDKSTVIFGK